jgi:predicted metal-dependent hydrolase
MSAKRPYRVIRSARKTVALELSPDLQLTVRAPETMSDRRIARFVADKSDWIERHTEKMRARPVLPEPSPEELGALREQALRVLPEKVRLWGERMGLRPPTRITITAARTRYGSCSAKNSISFSCRLMQREDDLIDYVVVHELAHIRHKNHASAFHALIEEYLPGHRALEKRLRGG